MWSKTGNWLTSTEYLFPFTGAQGVLSYYIPYVVNVPGCYKADFVSTFKENWFIRYNMLLISKIIILFINKIKNIFIVPRNFYNFFYVIFWGFLYFFSFSFTTDCFPFSFSPPCRISFTFSVFSS